MPNLNDPGWDDIFLKAGLQYNIDPRLLKALMYTESGANTPPEARIFAQSPQQAKGPMQQLESTFPGENVYDPSIAIPNAAKYLAEGMEKYNDPVKALMYYHGGPDTRQWGPKTNAYPYAVSKYYQMLGGNQEAPQPWAPNIIFGDSLAQQANNHAKVGGDFKIGIDPQEVYNRLSAYNGDLKGKNVIISSGISNTINKGNPEEYLPFVAAQLEYLKEAGAKPVILGVGPNTYLKGMNETLQSMAKEYGAAFQPLIGPFDKENIHPKNGRATYDAALKTATEFFK